MQIHWTQIDTVMFDMDGTLLDLAFDNFFWREAVPQAWAAQHQKPHEHALGTLAPLFAQHEGTLNWYSLPFWSQTLSLDLSQLKQQFRHQIALRHGVPAMLTELQRAGKTLWLVTNAHPIVLAIKLEQTGLGQYFSQIISSHDLGFAKEQAPFWQHLQQQQPFNPQRSLLIDDSEAVLQAAKNFGLHIVGIAQPDSSQPPRQQLTHHAIADWSALLHGLVASA